MAVPKIGAGGFFIQTERQFFFLIMSFAAIATLVAKNIARTKIGRSFVAIVIVISRRKLSGFRSPIARIFMAFAISASSMPAWLDA